MGGQICSNISCRFRGQKSPLFLCRFGGQKSPLFCTSFFVVLPFKVPEIRVGFRCQKGGQKTPLFCVVFGVVFDVKKGSKNDKKRGPLDEIFGVSDRLKINAQKRGDKNSGFPVHFGDWKVTKSRRFRCQKRVQKWQKVTKMWQKSDKNDTKSDRETDANSDIWNRHGFRVLWTWKVTKNDVKKGVKNETKITSFLCRFRDLQNVQKWQNRNLGNDEIPKSGKVPKSDVFGYLWDINGHNHIHVSTHNLSDGRRHTSSQIPQKSSIFIFFCH